MKSPSERRPNPSPTDEIGSVRAEIWDIEHAAVHIPMNGNLHASGAITIDGREVAQTLKCVHCQRTWIPVKGSGRIRGFCKYCMGPTCGPFCPGGTGCVHWEKAMDLAVAESARLAAMVD